MLSSAPTVLAVHACDSAGITLVAISRGDGFKAFDPRRADRRGLV